MFLDWLPTDDLWDQVHNTAWVASYRDHRLVVYAKGLGWCWKVTLPDGFMVAGINVKGIVEAFKSAEAASYRLSNVLDEPASNFEPLE